MIFNATRTATGDQQHLSIRYKLALAIPVCCFLAYVFAQQHVSSPKNSMAIHGKDKYKLNIRSTKVSREEEEEEFLNPKMVWLMSFPNSGTSFTMTLIRRVTNRTTATNYADEVTAPGYTSIPIYPNKEMEGPFWYGLNSTMTDTKRRLPDDYVMTKTHCGSRCMTCGPSKYVESTNHFLKECCKGHTRIKDSDGKIPYVDVWYPPERVKKAIHIIRNPMHNIISRFHLDWKNHMHQNKTDWLEKYPNSREGYHKWCAEMNSRNIHDKKTTFPKGFYSDVLKDVPCHDEFYRYVQWHNLAFDVVSNKLQKGTPSLVIHYEDYASKFDETVDSILSFLEIEKEGDCEKKFHGENSFALYDSFYTNEQMIEIEKLIKNVASGTTWEHMEQYFSKPSEEEETSS